MDHKIWRLLGAAVRSADRCVVRTSRTPVYTDQRIVKMYFWTVWHDRPLCWACDRSHYNTAYRPGQLPSVSQFCRRVKTERVQAMIEHISKRLSHGDRPVDIASIDGKALPISDYTSDSDAKTGYGCGRFQRGYKLHACVGDDDRVYGFEVHPMNVAEQTVAYDLLSAIEPGMLVLGDSNYDSSRLYQRCADRGAAMLTPLKGHSRCQRRRRRLPVTRLDAMALWDQHPGLACSLLRQRDRIERVFATLTGIGWGLKGLPPWVRRLACVRRWVTAKMIFYHAHLTIRRQTA